MQSTVRDRKSGAIESRRVAVTRPVELRYPLRQGYVIRSCLDISMTGMFVSTADPLPVGTAISFRCRLVDDRPVAGIAEVRWIRERAGGESRPAGMGVRFLELEDASSRALRRLVETRLHSVPSLETSDTETTDAPAAKKEPTGGEPGLDHSPAPVAHASPWGASAEWREEIRRRRRRRRATRILGLLILTVAVATLWLAAPGPIRRLLAPEPETRTKALATAPADEPAQHAVAEETAIVPVVPTATGGEAEPASSLQSEIEAFVAEWTGAWMDQRVDDYLNCYSSAFEPLDMDRASWSEQRRARIGRPGFIQIGVLGLSVEPLGDPAEGPPEARATFVQTYRSDMYRDSVLKTLDLVRDEDGWLILRESSQPIDV